MSTRMRDEWTFDYSVSTLLEATRAKVAHHAERLAHWTTERDAREEKLRAEGIDVRPAVRAGGSTSAAYYGQPTLDAELLDKLHEAQERVDHHTTHLADFERWQRALEHDAGATVTRSLTVDDVAFFGL